MNEKIEKYAGNIEQIHLCINGHVEVFQYGEDLPNDSEYRIFAIYLSDGTVIR